MQPGDTLSAIADRELGDPDDYPELFAANRHTLQHDGRKLEDPDLIVPGWTLQIPGPRTGTPTPRKPTGRTPGPRQPGTRRGRDDPPLAYLRPDRQANLRSNR